MTKKQSSLGIVTVHNEVSDLNHERYSIYNVASRYFDDIVLIDPTETRYEFIMGNEYCAIYHGDSDISNLDVLFVRSTKGKEAPIAILVRALAANGCDTIDPIDRFPVGYASKILSTVRRFSQGVGMTSLLAFNADQANRLLDTALQRSLFPLIGKPVSGRKGQGIVLLADQADASCYIVDFFRDETSGQVPILLQQYIKFEAEFRVVVLDGESLGIVRKTKQVGALAANAAQGGTFEAVNNPAIESFAVNNVSDVGIVGVDVAIDRDQNLYIIEANRAPLWSSFENATGIDVAEEILRRHS